MFVFFLHCSQSLFTLDLLEEFLCKRKVPRPAMNENWCKNQSYFSKSVLSVDCSLRYQSDTYHCECKIRINLKVLDEVRQQKDTQHRCRLALCDEVRQQKDTKHRCRLALLYDEAICPNKNSALILSCVSLTALIFSNLCDLTLSCVSLTALIFYNSCDFRTGW